MRERSCRGLCSDGGGGEKKKERERVARAAAAHLKVPLLFRVTCGGPQWRRRRRSYKRERETERICTLDRQSQRAFQIAAAAPPPPSLPPRPPPWEYLDVCGKSFEERERQTFITDKGIGRARISNHVSIAAAAANGKRFRLDSHLNF